MAENDKSLMKSPSTAIQVASVESKNEVLVVKPSGSADPIYQEGQILMKYKHYADALFCFEQVVDGLAKALRWVGQFEEAIQAFKQAIVLNVKDYWPHREYRELAKAYHYWGKQKFEQGYYEQAIECYRDAIVADSNYHEVSRLCHTFDENQRQTHVTTGIKLYQSVRVVIMRVCGNAAILNSHDASIICIHEGLLWD